jgi:hypothetical protein
MIPDCASLIGGFMAVGMLRDRSTASDRANRRAKSDGDNRLATA